MAPATGSVETAPTIILVAGSKHEADVNGWLKAVKCYDPDISFREYSHLLEARLFNSANCINTRVSVQYKLI